jgi:hypothetical protein
MTAKELKLEKILKLSGSYWETCTLHAGVREIRRIFFESPNDSGIITGIV